MEATAAWGEPFELKLATNWAVEEPPADDAQVWAPAVGLPLQYQYASIVDIFGSSCSLQQPCYVPASIVSSEGQQLVEYKYNYDYNYYAAAATQHHDHHDPIEKTMAAQQEEPSFEEQMETYMNHPIQLFQETKDRFKCEADLMKKKMHRYPPSIRALDDGDGLYTVPRVVAIGPYHHYGQDHLKRAEKVKHVAAFHCIEKSGLSVLEMYHAVVSVVTEIDARGLYDKDVMEGIGDDEFLPMMFYDACFVVMYMVKRSGTAGCEAVLFDFFESNDNEIAHDVMLLENQIPWPVVEAIMNRYKTTEPFLKGFISMCKDGCLRDRAADAPSTAADLDEDYEPPHLLGFLRYYIVGKRERTGSSKNIEVSDEDMEKMTSMPISVGAVELAEMGIHLTANETTALPDMGLTKKWFVFAELSMAPLSLNDARASLLVNMAALELCTTPDFFEKKNPNFEDSAVCSYLLLLHMLMHKEEDVHELRANGILQGAGLTNKKALDFFTSLQSLRIGRCYAVVMVQIENYRRKRPWLKLYASLYRNRKTITWVASAISAFIGIITTLIKVKGAI